MNGGWIAMILIPFVISLIKGYLRVGAGVCGPPALDRDFGTTDFLVLLDIQKLSSE
jgi:putative hemolysin